MKVLITDLDNTLYDWVTFFSKSFTSMVDELVFLLNVEREIILDEFKELNKKYGSSERAYTMLELPSVKKKFGYLNVSNINDEMMKPLRAFNDSKRKFLRLYDGVEFTLRKLHENGIIIIGYTEAYDENGLERLNFLKVSKYFTRLYATDSGVDKNLLTDRESQLNINRNFVISLPKKDKKPNPQVLISICEREHIKLEDVVYIGDSLAKDISMAKKANVKSVLARYGKNYDERLWEILVRVTHWTREDIDREERLNFMCSNIQPDFTIDRFDDLLNIFNL